MGGMHGGRQGSGSQGMTPPQQGQAMGGSMMQKEQDMMKKEMGGMQGGTPQGGASTTMPGMGAASPSTTPGVTGMPMSDMDQMMRRIGEHSTYMETVKDSAMLQQEMLRHQKMVDQMIQLMQR